MGIARAAAAVAGVGIAVFAGTGALDDNTVRDDSGSITAAGGLGAFALQVGDCINQPDVDAELIASVEGVPCETPHDFEVFAEYQMTESAYPPQAVMDQTTWDRCFTYFEGYVGTSFGQSTLGITTYTPSSGSWAEGDREVSCLLYGYQGSKLTGSAEGSRL